VAHTGALAGAPCRETAITQRIQQHHLVHMLLVLPLLTLTDLLLPPAA
jgi:hypothetical protein